MTMYYFSFKKENTKDATPVEFLWPFFSTEECTPSSERANL